MKKYSVIYSDEAIIDLEDIEKYIAVELRNPVSAWDTVDGIMSIAEKLIQSPEKHQLVEDSYLAKLGFRLVYFNNYNVLYVVREDEVFIVRIFYNRRDWIGLLKNRDIYPVK